MTDPDWLALVAPDHPVPPPRLGIRYDATGRFLPEAGNTVVRAVIPGSATEAALHALRAALQALPWAGAFAFTAPESWHMTVFEGVIETRRRAADFPEGIDPGVDIDTATARMASRLAAFRAPPDFAMAPVAVTPFGLRLAGATAEDEARARAWRDGLAAALQLHRAGHAAYVFHTTLAYGMAPLDPGLRPALQAAMAELTAAFRSRVTAMDLGPPAFCRFADMNAFPPVMTL
jgi:hypothetical protein